MGATLFEGFVVCDSLNYWLTVCQIPVLVFANGGW